METTQTSNEIAKYEEELPLPYAFKKLVSLFRVIGKNYKQSGDNQQALLYFNKMLSLSKLWHNFYGHKTSGITGGEVDKAEKSLGQFLAKHQTLYPFTFQKDGAIPNDILLSSADYKNLQITTGFIDKSTSTSKPLSKASIESKISKALETRHIDEYGIPVRWIEGKKLGAPKAKAAYLGISGKVLSIETYVIEYYQSLGYFGYWTENEYWWAIMSLLFWDVIFVNLPGAFSSLIQLTQDMPDDFFSSSFYSKRKSLIEKRISELTQPSLFGLKRPNIEAELISAYKNHYRQPCRSMDWGKYRIVDELLLATKSLTDTQLIGIMKRLLLNFNENRRGVPDLFLVKDNLAIFVEVKSEKEQVADHQYAWHKYIKNEIGIPVEICRVVNIVE